MKSLVAFVPFLLAVVAAGSSGVLFEVDGAWYRDLRAPSFRPPSWVFGPVWSLLYLMIAVAGWRLALQAGSARPEAAAAGLALGLWALQITLNALWTPAFFGAHALGAALLVIGALWLAILALIVVSWRVDRLAAGLLVPYLAWVSFAVVLNFAYWRLN